MAGLQISNISSQGGDISCFCSGAGMPACIIWPATRQLRVCRARRPTSILSVDKFKLCLCLVFRPHEVLLLFFLVANKKLSGGERSGYNLFYSRLARNSTVDGWTPIYPHLDVINVNGLARVGACERSTACVLLPFVPTFSRITLLCSLSKGFVL